MMGNRGNHPQIGGQSFHIGDCFIWAEINYLDSPSDYREYLQPNPERVDICLKSPLLMLSESIPRKSQHRYAQPSNVQSFLERVSSLLSSVSSIF
jgi:hypothetical protein